MLEKELNNLVADLDILVAGLCVVVLGCAIFSLMVYVERLWGQNKKLTAALVPLTLVMLGLLVAPTWTIVLLVVGLFVFAASFVRTSRFILATVVVVSGFLASMATVARDEYMIRSDVQEAVTATAETRKAIEALVRKGHTLGTLPVRSGSISTADSGTHASSVSYDKNGVVTITLVDHKHLGAARSKTLFYVPTPHDGRLAWELSEKSTVPPKYRPKLSAWSPRKYEGKFKAIVHGTDRETVIAELGEPKTTTTNLFLTESSGETSNYQMLPETTYYLLWEHRGSAFVVGFDENDRSTEKLDGLRFP